MKTTNLIITVALLFAAKLATAQTEKGTQNLGADASFSHQGLTGTTLDYNGTTSSLDPLTERATQLSIGPSYSYFIADKLDIGADLSYSHFSSFQASDFTPERQNQNTCSGEIFLRKYIMCSAKFGFRAGPYAGYSHSDVSYTYASYFPGEIDHSNSQSLYGGVSLAMVYYPQKHLGVSATLANAGYSHVKQNNGANGSNDTNNFSLALVTDNVGISVFYVF